MLKKSLTINGVKKTIIVDPESTLADILRKQLFLTGTKISCDEGSFGASGEGELPNTAPQDAIINAVYRATGARIHELPAYPHKVLTALAELN